MPIWPFSASQADNDADLILLQVTRASRNPAFFGEGRVPDTIEGRFELLAFNAALVLIRLRQAPEAEPLMQAFVDRLFKHLDSGLRENAVGDLAVPKRVHKLAGAFYGRAEAYAAALARADLADLEAAVSRNVLGMAEAPFAAVMAQQLQRAARIQAQLPWTALLSEEAWPPFVA